MHSIPQESSASKSMTEGRKEKTPWLGKKNNKKKIFEL